MKLSVMAKKLLAHPFFAQHQDLTILELMEKEKDTFSGALLIELTLHPDFRDDDLRKRLGDLTEVAPQQNSPVWSNLADWFEKVDFYPPAEPYRLKFAADCLFSSIEEVLKTALFTRMKHIWDEKKNYIPKLLISNRFDWSLEIRNWLEAMPKNHPEWIEKRPPISTMLTSLRYILSVEDADSFQATILDYAIFILFLSKPMNLNLNGDDASELGFRLLQLHLDRIHLNFHKKIEIQKYSKLKFNIQKVNQLLAKISASLPQEKKAA